jgi:hypothetical protein
MQILHRFAGSIQRYSEELSDRKWIAPESRLSRKPSAWPSNALAEWFQWSRPNRYRYKVGAPRISLFAQSASSKTSGFGALFEQCVVRLTSVPRVRHLFGGFWRTR